MADARLFQLGTLVAGAYQITLQAEDAASTVTLDNVNFEVENTDGTQRNIKITSAVAGDTTLTLSGNATIGDWLDQSVKAASSPTFAAITGLTTPLAAGDGGTGVSTLADGGVVVGNATGAVECDAAGATTEILVGGGASTKPVWTTATGSGAPVRATSPTLVTPNIGAATLGGIMTVGENTIQLDASLSADGKYSGVTCDGVIGYASAAYGELVYLANGDDRWEKTDANAVATAGDVMLALVVSSGASDGDACVLLLYGFMREDDWNFTSGGDSLYVSETAGAMTATAPSTASAVVRVVGYAGQNADTVFFNPSKSWVEIAA